MRRADIRFGRKYRVRNGVGPAEVLGPERKPPGFSNTVEFLVRFPMAPSDRPDRWVSTRDFLNPWGAEDEQRFESAMRERAQIKALKAGLTAAGFPPERAHYLTREDGDLYLFFQGEVADRVVEALLGHAGISPPAELAAPAHQLGAGEQGG